MFDRESELTITESVVESADSAVESADSNTNTAADPLKIGLWVRAFRQSFDKGDRASKRVCVCCAVRCCHQTSASGLTTCSIKLPESIIGNVPLHQTICGSNIASFRKCIVIYEPVEPKVFHKSIAYYVKW